MKKVAAALSLILLAFIASFLTYHSEIQNQSRLPVFNEIRLLTNPAMDSVQKNFNKLSHYEQFRSILLPELDRAELQLRIADTSGNLLFDSNKNSKEFQSDKINLAKEVHYDLSFQNQKHGSVSFSFPVLIDGVQTANALFIMPSAKLSDQNNSIVLAFIPAMAGFLAGAFLIIQSFGKLKKDYVLPVRKLTRTIPEMIKGNLDVPLESYEHNEMGEFTRSLDLMRTELKDSMTRKSKLETERKELVASISHDIKTPLSSIKAYAEGLRDGIAKSREDVDRFIGVILSKTDSLIKLVNDLIQHSMQDLGSLSIKLEDHYSRGLLKNILDPLQLKYKTSPISLEIEGELPDVLVRADALRLEQVMVNLIQNAEKYAPEGGRILVSAVQEDNCLLVSVCDNGKGIPPEELPFIFDRYYRGEKAVKSNIEGYGLGLSICKYIIEKHGGTIFAESIKGKGSIFRFTLPKT